MPRHRSMLRHVFPLLLGLLLAASGALAAEPPRYGAWPGVAQDAEQLVDELQRMLDDARRARAGHPAFLDDLQALVDRHRKPRRTVLFEDAFDDWNYDQGPAWRVLSGEFNVGSAGAWLRTRQSVEERTGGRQETQEQGDPATQLVFGILNELARDRDQEARDSRSTRKGQREQAGMIHVAAEIDNAFTLQYKVRSRGNRSGEYRVGVYQGDRLRNGYRLAYHAGNGLVQLLTMRRGQPTALAEVSLRGLGLDDDRDHLFSWTRGRDGEMTVSVDGVERLRAQDRSYRDPFSGLVLINAGGHYWFDDFLVYADR